MTHEETPLLTPLLEGEPAAAAKMPTEPEPPQEPRPRSRLRGAWAKAQHVVVPLVLDIVPDTILGYLVQYSRDDPGARILTAFTFASLVQSQVVAALQVVLRTTLDTHRNRLSDPLKRRELWVLAQAAWFVYMSYLPFAGLICGYTAWLSREALFGQNADVADVVATLLVINLVSLPFSLGSAMLRSDLEAHESLRPFVVAAIVSWTIGLSFAYVLGYWVELGFTGIALTDIITYGIMFRMLAPETQLLTEWPGWHFREALTMVPKIACHPAMIGILLVNLTMMLFGFTSLLASLIKVDLVVIDAQTDVFPSLLMLSFMPLLGVCLLCSMMIKSTLASLHGHDSKPVVSPRKLLVAIFLLTAFATSSWLVGALHVGEKEVPPWLLGMFKDTLTVQVPLYPPLGFILVIRPVLRTCVELWHHASTLFLVTMAIGASLGATFAEELDGGIQGLWFGQYIAIIVFTVIAAVSIRRWVSHPTAKIADSASEDVIAFVA